MIILLLVVVKILVNSQLLMIYNYVILKRVLHHLRLLKFTLRSRKRHCPNYLNYEHNIVPCSSKRSEMINQTLVKMVALNQMRISFCSSAGFTYFISVVELNHKPIKKEALKKRLHVLKKNVKEKVKKKLHSVQSVLCTSLGHCHNNHI